MTAMQFYNAAYFGQDGQFHYGGFRVEDGRFQAVGGVTAGRDLENAYVIPGLIDLHTHGNSGHDFSACGVEELKIIARAHARSGVTGFCPTSMALPEVALARAFSNAARLKSASAAGAARVLGINMEGPFLAPKRKGAQDGSHLRPPDLALFRRLQGAAEGAIALVDLAPELPGALDFARALKGEVVLSLAHSDGSYDEAAAGFAAGFSHVTHLFNAMPGLGHRAPGPIAAAAERDDVTAELIADGVHIHPSMVRLAFRLFGGARICLVSDSMEACFMPDGAYQLGGQAVTVKGPLATLADGTIAGAATPLLRCMQNVIGWGVPKEEAVRAATLTPAGRLGLAHEYGAVADGRRASFLILDEGFALKEVFLEGEPLDG